MRFVLAVLFLFVASGCDKVKASPPVESPEQAQIRELQSRVAALEAKPKVQHHYELRTDGSRTWRFDPDTGKICIQLTTDADWKAPKTIREGCPYSDWAHGSGATMADYYEAECVLLGSKKACEESEKRSK